MPSYKMTQHFEEAYNFIHEGLKKGNVLVHCAAGISRVIIIFILVNYLRFSIFDETIRTYL
jgi:protein-tyrosine phosphatase